MTMNRSLEYIYKEQKELSVLGGIGALLGWDQMTYMPQMGIMERSEQISLISRLSHDKVISDELYNHVEKLNEQEQIVHLKEHDQAVVRRLKKDIEKARKVPPAFVEKLSKTTTIAYNAWQEAREKANFTLFQPHLEKIVELEKEYASYINLPGPSYNSVLDDYEEGMTVDILRKEFATLRKELVRMLERITTSKAYQSQMPFDKTFDRDIQKQLCQLIIDHMKLPESRSRLDISTHPFTTSMGTDDVRITTNFERGNALFAFFSTVHEAGHALYELGLPINEYKDTVISDAPSLGLHESQSRFWENMIARNKYFWRYMYPLFQKHVPNQLKDIRLETWYHYVNQVRPSCVRVEADELTYCLHVILRFELELGLMEDEIKVSELPTVWNEKMYDLLGIRPANDKGGVLQDMHWSGGSFGYFPTYAIGTMYAAQLYHKLVSEKPDIQDEIQQGKFETVLEWLHTHVHRYGRLMTADEIIKKACGEGLNSQVFIKYLKDKYYELYTI